MRVSHPRDAQPASQLVLRYQLSRGEGDGLQASQPQIADAGSLLRCWGDGEVDGAIGAVGAFLNIAPQPRMLCPLDCNAGMGDAARADGASGAPGTNGKHANTRARGTTYGHLSSSFDSRIGAHPGVVSSGQCSVRGTNAPRSNAPRTLLATNARSLGPSRDARTAADETRPRPAARTLPGTKLYHHSDVPSAWSAIRLLYQNLGRTHPRCGTVYVMPTTPVHVE